MVRIALILCSAVCTIYEIVQLEHITKELRTIKHLNGRFRNVFAVQVWVTVSVYHLCEKLPS